MDRWPKELMPMVPGGGEDDSGAGWKGRGVIQVPEEENPIDELEAELYKYMETSDENESHSEPIKAVHLFAPIRVPPRNHSAETATTADEEEKEEGEESKDEKDEEERRGRPLKRKGGPGKGERKRKKKKKGGH